MTTASEEIQDKIKTSYFIKGLEREVARILKKFEESDKPVVYDQEREQMHTLKMVQPPWQEELLKSLGFLDEVGGGYDWHKSFLNAKAHEMYERLKEEGYYSKESIPNSTDIKPNYV